MDIFAGRPAFTDANWPSDVLRFVLVGSAIFLAMVVLRVVWLRFRSPEGSAERERSIWGLLSYAGFIGLVIYEGLERFGLPADPFRVVLYLFSVGCGIVSVGTTVKFRWWRQQPAVTQREIDRRVGERLRHRQEDRDAGRPVDE